MKQILHSFFVSIRRPVPIRYDYCRDRSLPSGRRRAARPCKCGSVRNTSHGPLHSADLHVCPQLVEPTLRIETSVGSSKMKIVGVCKKPRAIPAAEPFHRKTFFTSASFRSKSSKEHFSRSAARSPAPSPAHDRARRANPCLPGRSILIEARILKPVPKLEALRSRARRIAPVHSDRSAVAFSSVVSLLMVVSSAPFVREPQKSPP